jgi:hypothetical protein
LRRGVERHQRSGGCNTERFDDTELIGAEVEDQIATRNKGFDIERAQQAIALKLGQVQRVLAAAR